MFFKKQIIDIHKVVFLITLSIAALVSAEGISDIIAPGATLNEIQSNFSFAEGPATDTAGNIYFSYLRAECY